MAKLRFKIITPERVALEGACHSLTATTENGEITVLPGHIPLATLLRPGEMRVKDEGREELLAVAGGLLEVLPNNEIIILAEAAEHAEELELDAIEKAKALAEEALLKIRSREDVGFADAAAHLERELARYRVALKGKKTRRN